MKMPITPENKKRYPKNWKEIRKRILKRANNKCEFEGCNAENYKPHPITGSKVILTIAHLNHIPEDCRDENLKAGCQRCHNRYDIKNRVKNRRERKIIEIRNNHIPLIHT